MKIYLIAAVSLVLTACAGSSPRIDPARLSALQKGQTTIAEVTRQFGRPSILSKNPDGTQTAIYMHDDGRGGTTMVPLITTTPSDSETFYFDTRGVLTDYKISQAHANASAPDAAINTTQTEPGKPKPGSSSTWFPALIPSATKQNR